MNQNYNMSFKEIKQALIQGEEESKNAQQEQPQNDSSSDDEREEIDQEGPVFETVNYTNGSRYVGQVSGGAEQLYHGYGRYTSSNGDWYEGEWANDKKNGVGTYQYASGQMYEGQWLDDDKHGYGIYKY